MENEIYQNVANYNCCIKVKKQIINNLKAKLPLPSDFDNILRGIFEAFLHMDYETYVEDDLFVREIRNPSIGHLPLNLDGLSEFEIYEINTLRKARKARSNLMLKIRRLKNKMYQVPEKKSRKRNNADYDDYNINEDKDEYDDNPASSTTTNNKASISDKFSWSEIKIRKDSPSQSFLMNTQEEEEAYILRKAEEKAGIARAVEIFGNDDNGNCY